MKRSIFWQQKEVYLKQFVAIIGTLYFLRGHIPPEPPLLGVVASFAPVMYPPEIYSCVRPWVYV